MRHCEITGLPILDCPCGSCDDDDPMAEAVAQAWRDDGSDGEPGT